MKKLIGFLLLILVSSCSKEDDLQTNQVIECLGEAELSSNMLTCENNDLALNEFYCDVIHIGEFQLETESKEFMVQACKNVGDIIQYENEAGDVIEFEITSNSYKVGFIAFNRNEICENDPTKAIGYCLTRETIRFVLNSTNPDLEIIIEIETDSDRTADDVGPVGDFLRIYRGLSPGVFTGSFNAVLSQRTLSYDRTFLQQNFETLQILDTEYTNVISNDISLFTTSTFKYYYNNTDGLIGFQDRDLVTWKLK